ncbi:HAD-IA family hydrolase [Phenylobacterium sp.]|uniref:HAD family hydrolase n=1 Tax=Phenylobacterium sp. TaxID=1871053 RepID=UPI002899D128|nr:HAD-IA family hydrolase [Phenylobacterium sp.]
MSKPVISALLFDADGVIQRAPHFAQRLEKAFGAAPTDLAGCVAEIFAAETPCLSGKGEYTEALKPVLQRWGAGCDPLEFLEAWHLIDADAGVLCLIETLRATGVYCALASNQEAHRARRMSDALGYRTMFDAEFYSCDIGHAKPDPRYFEHILSSASLDARRTLFIDDRPDNVDAARAVGLNAMLFELEGRPECADRLAICLSAYDLRPI